MAMFPKVCSRRRALIHGLALLQCRALGRNCHKEAILGRGGAGAARSRHSSVFLAARGPRSDWLMARVVFKCAAIESDSSSAAGIHLNQIA